MNVLTKEWNSYAKDLVNIMYGENGPDFGAASDGITLSPLSASIGVLSVPLVVYKQKNYPVGKV